MIEIDGPILLVVNSLRTPPFSLGQLTSLGIEPARQAIIVVKAAVAYKAAYGRLRDGSSRWIRLDSPASTRGGFIISGHCGRRRSRRSEVGIGIRLFTVVRKRLEGTLTAEGLGHRHAFGELGAPITAIK